MSAQPPIRRPAPVVPWATMQAEGRQIPRARRMGAAIGFAVGLTMVLGALVVTALTHTGPFDGSPIQVGSAAGGALFAAIVAGTGALGGAMLAPAALGSRTRWEWAAVTLALGLLAVLIGALLVGISFSAFGAFDDPIGLHLIFAILAGSVLGLIGVAIYGVFALPFTMIAAILWSLAMWLMRSRLSTRR